MLTATLQSLFARDLARLRTEIDAYNDETNIWKTDGQIANSAGNLCLHLIGNLNTYIGKELGGTGDVRNRELEFSVKNVPRSELLKKIKDTAKIVRTALAAIDEEGLLKEYPVLVFKGKTSTGYLLVHLTTHLSDHLGQINYHRRLLDAVSDPQDALRGKAER